VGVLVGEVPLYETGMAMFSRYYSPRQKKGVGRVNKLAAATEYRTVYVQEYLAHKKLPPP